MYMAQYTNGSQIPMFTSIADPTGQIVQANSTTVDLASGYYLVSYDVSALLDPAGYMQVTPSYNGTSHIEFGLYFKTAADNVSAYGSISFIIYVPAPTTFTLTYNSPSTSTEGTLSLVFVKLNRTT